MGKGVHFSGMPGITTPGNWHKQPLHLSLLAIEGGKNAATPFDATLQHMPQDGNPRATIRHLDSEIEGFFHQKDPA